MIDMKTKQILTSPFKILLSLVKATINLIYPPYCIVCNSYLAETERLICSSCWFNLPQIKEDFDLLNEIKSGLNEETHFSEAFSVWDFSPPIQAAVHHLKYQNFKVLANRVGAFMAERLKKLSLPLDKTILIPIPLHKTRIRERGYNQSSLLCQVITSEIDLPYNDQILKRTRYTQSQTKLNAAERAKNVENAFKVISAKAIQNKIVILVDDVITTGSTMNECARELIKNGANCVYIFSMAKA